VQEGGKGSHSPPTLVHLGVIGEIGVGVVVVLLLRMPDACPLNSRLGREEEEGRGEDQGGKGGPLLGRGRARGSRERGDDTGRKHARVAAIFVA